MTLASENSIINGLPWMCGVYVTPPPPQQKRAPTGSLLKMAAEGEPGFRAAQRRAGERPHTDVRAGGVKSATVKPWMATMI